MLLQVAAQTCSIIEEYIYIYMLVVTGITATATKYDSKGTIGFESVILFI
jgi:hypothetical protein